jgi:hypothetical protein
MQKLWNWRRAETLLRLGFKIKYLMEIESIRKSFLFLRFQQGEK